MVPGTSLQRRVRPAVTGEPADHDGGGTGRVAAQIVAVTWAYGDLDAGARVRYPERITVAVDDERLDAGDEFGGPGGTGTAGRVQREGEGENPLRANDRGRTAGDPGATGPAADDQRAVLRQGGEHRDPGFVEYGCPGRGTPAGDPVRLGDPRHGDVRRERGVEYGQQVRCVDTAPGTVAEDEQTPYPTCRPFVPDRRRTVRRRYFGQEATRSSATSGVRGFGISSRIRMPVSAAGFCVPFSDRHATSMARRSRGVVAPHTP